MEVKSACILYICESGQESVWDKEQIVLGREPGCDVAFPDCKSISRRHAIVFQRAGAWFVMDMGSSNGTWLNGQRLRDHVELPLQKGDRIDLAHTRTIQFRPKEDPLAYDPAELPPPAMSVCPPPATSAPVSRPAARFCVSCGSELTGNFCSACGAKAAFAPAAVCPPPAPSAAAPSPSASRAAPAPMAQYTPEKPKKANPFAGLFAGRKSKQEEVQTDDIQFRAAAPAALVPGEYFDVKVMLYREEDYERAQREEKTIADRVKAATSSVFQAKRQDVFRISLQSPDIPIDCDSQELCWNGKYAAADFQVLLPEEYDRKQLRLTGRVYAGIAVLTDLKLILQIDAPRQQEVHVEKCRLSTAFISYASQDRAKVVARIQGIQLSRPDMDLFFDAESLRRGEQWEQRLYREIRQRDLFYLFWSRNAAQSEWVAKELAFALENKGAMAVEPVPLEEPAVCPPPECLQDRHFNDWTLRYLADK